LDIEHGEKVALTTIVVKDKSRLSDEFAEWQRDRDRYEHPLEQVLLGQLESTSDCGQARRLRRRLA
jgi:hypothetical protein